MKNHELLSSFLFFAFTVSIIIASGVKKYFYERTIIKKSDNVQNNIGSHGTGRIVFTKQHTETQNIFGGNIDEQSESASVLDVIDKIYEYRDILAQNFKVLYSHNSTSSNIIQELRNIEKSFNEQILQKKLAN